MYNKDVSKASWFVTVDLELRTAYVLNIFTIELTSAWSEFLIYENWKGN